MGNFYDDLQSLLNRYGIDAELNTPDYVLKDLLRSFLEALAAMEHGKAAHEGRQKSELFWCDYTDGEAER